MNDHEDDIDDRFFNEKKNPKEDQLTLQVCDSQPA